MVMKRITIRNGDNVKSVDIFRNVLSVNQQGMSIDDIRKRIRILDVIDELDESDTFMDLEDLDYLTLKNAIQTQKWVIADRNLLRIIDDVLEAETPSDKLKAVAG